MLLPSSNEVCEGYVFMPVCQSFCSWGGGLPQCMLGYTPLGSRHIWEADTPQSRHPLEADNPQKQTPPEADTPSCAVHAGRYSQQAGGTHPTGMHTCSDKVVFK